MSETLYRKYRSKKLTDIRGQEHITDILTRSLAKGVVSHAYLLTGPRGVGKTSVARILAHEINRLPYDDGTDHLDIIEIDAASNNSVEDIRDLREKARVAPVSADKKIYIIDEVHMLSKAAFNALLKTLEEPPEHVVFILATTDANKLPDTIVSRTQRFSFHAISPAVAVRHLATIAKQEKIKIDEPALGLIAEHGDGSFRDSIGLLDQLRSLTDKNETITRDLVEHSLGLAPTKLIETIIAARTDGDLKSLVATLDDAETHGVPAHLLARQLAQYIRSIIATSPQLVPLLDGLLEVAKSSDPRTKLLVVLADGLTPKPKTSALNVGTAPIRELEIAATTPHPVDPTPPKVSESLQKVVSLEKASSVKPTNVSKKSSAFNWAEVVEVARKEYVATYSVLNKCIGELDGGTLRIFTRNGFYKKKIDDPKYRKNLTSCLDTFGLGDITIETVPSIAPPKDSQTAAVAAIMGGGEEIAFEG